MFTNALDTGRHPVIGNDIVDLNFVDSPPYQHARHLERVCTMTESRAVRQSSDPSANVAIIWAAKEATYKAIVQRGIVCKFVPREFVTYFEDREPAQSGYKIPVSYCGSRWHVKIDVTPRWVHAIAAHPEDCIVNWAVAKIENSGSGSAAAESSAARRTAADLLIASDANDLALQTAGGLPILRRQATGDSAAIGISLSHHGGFAAAALAWIVET